MKNLHLLVTISLIIAVLYLIYTVSYANKDETVYINTPKLISQYEGMKAAQKEFQEKTKVWNANVDTLGKELEAGIKKLEKDRAKMSAKEVELSEQLMQQKQQQFLQYQQAIQKKIIDEDKKISSVVLSEINVFLTELGKKNSYKYILGATNTGNLIYADEKCDITQQVLEELNSKYKTK